MAVDTIKSNFFEENPEFEEIKVTGSTIHEFRHIDLKHERVWLMQCPKGTDVTQLEGQKLKLPGRSNIRCTNEINLEAIAIEFSEPKNSAFGYCNKRDYALRLMPLSGSVILRNRIKASEPITAEEIKTACPPKGRVPMPQLIKVRHPLLGVNFEEKSHIDEDIADRLQHADEESLTCKRTRLNGKTRFATDGELPIHIKQEADVSKAAKSKKKRKHIKSESSQAAETISTKKKKPIKIEKQEPEDLEWLKNL